MGHKRSLTLWFGILIAVAIISVITPAGIRRANAQGPYWDLVVNTVEVIGFEEEGRVAVLFVEVANLGLEDVPPSTLAVYVEGAEDIIAFVPIDALGPERAQEVEVRLELPEDWGGSERSFAAEADVHNEIQEDFEDNNFASSGPRRTSARTDRAAGGTTSRTYSRARSRATALFRRCPVTAAGTAADRWGTWGYGGSRRRADHPLHDQDPASERVAAKGQKGKSTRYVPAAAALLRGRDGDRVEDAERHRGRPRGDGCRHRQPENEKGQG